MQRETKIAHVADFGSTLRQARRRLGLAQKETAEFCGVSVTYLYQLEKGKEAIEFGKAIEIVRRLAPAYDLVSTVRFENYSRSLAMAVGGVRDIDEVDADALERFCVDISLPLALGKKAAAGLLGSFDDALRMCVARVKTNHDDVEFEADSLQDECAPRLLVLDEFARA